MYEYSSSGRYVVGSWQCERCDAGSGEIILGRAEDQELRQAATAHLQTYGHQVELLRGTREHLIPLRTEAPR